MIGKNIKKSLNAKMKDWLKNVDNDDIKKIIMENAIITGGSIVSMLNNEEVNDYDVYFRTQDAVIKITNYYVAKFNENHKNIAEVKVGDDTGRVSIFIQSAGTASENNGVTDESEPTPFKEPSDEKTNAEPELKPKYRPVYLSSNAITLSDKIQIIIRFYGEPKEIHENYDFVHCTCYWTSWNNELCLPSRALEAIINKELYYMGSKYPLCSIIRTRKFINRGYTINAGQYLKMALQLNQLDLLNVDTLEDQLMGVDSAYFAAAIRSIKERQTSEPEWKLDDGYLFEIINRIF